MEVHKYTDIMGMDLAENLYEGRMVWFNQFGAHLPHNPAQALLSRYVVAWLQDNRVPPLYQPYPTYARALRYGFEQAGNLPFVGLVYATYPGLKDECPGAMLYSGMDVLLYDEGEFTVASGCWVYSVVAQPGMELEASIAAPTAGMLQLLAQGVAVAIITNIDVHGNLRFRSYGD